MRYNAQVLFRIIGIFLKNLTQKIAKTLKTLRQQREWSLDTTSQKTGVSKAMLGQIEREESSPTIATLWKIADGFKVSFSSLIADLSPLTQTPIHRSNFLHELDPQDNKIHVIPLFPYDPTLKFELFVITLSPGCEHRSLPHQTGVVEHIVVADGEMEVCIGETWHRLKEREGLHFNADQPHGYRNLKNKKAVFHNIIHYTLI